MSALQALLISAQLAGVPGDFAGPKIAPGVLADGPQVVGQAPLKGVSAGQLRATMYRSIGAERVGFSLALGDDGYLWLKARHGKDAAVYSIPRLRAGVSAKLGDVEFEMFMRGDAIDIASAAGEARPGHGSL
jgi:hypothetical protein